MVTLGIGGCLVSGYTENLGLALVVVANLICLKVDNRFAVQVALPVVTGVVYLFVVLCDVSAEN